MAFFNKKTEVLSVELTQYGKHLLSIGKFKPVYYNFFDNDVLYDSEYGGITETRNNIQERIMNETPYLKTQYLFYGVETKLREQIKLKRQLESLARTEGKKLNEAISVQQPEDKFYFTSSPLGTSNLTSELPTFNIFSYGTQIQSSSLNKVLNYSLLKIPQISMNNSVYEIMVDTAPPDYILPETYEIGPNFAINSEIVYNDGHVLKVNKQNILLEIEETNINQTEDNFDIELYEITSSVAGLETYKQLYFLSEDSISDENAIEDPTLVDHYFSIKIDEQLDMESLKKMRISQLSPKIYQPIKK